VVDSVGSHTLANACAQTRAEGVVTRMWPRARPWISGDRRAVHPACVKPARVQFRNVSAGVARARLGCARALNLTRGALMQSREVGLADARASRTTSSPQRCVAAWWVNVTVTQPPRRCAMVSADECAGLLFSHLAGFAARDPCVHLETTGTP